MTLKTFAFSCVLLITISSFPRSIFAQSLQTDTARTISSSTKAEGTKHIRGVQYSSPEEAAAALAAQKKMPFFAGVSISADLCGLVMASFTPYGQYEAAARINLRGRFFPIAEIGIGTSNHTNETTNLHYRVHSPYFRVGMDYNVAKDVRSGNRIFAGVRYGYTSFKYDLDGPDMSDAVYGTTQSFHFEGLRGKNHWGEVVAGLEARVWGMLHLGWTIRYRMRISNKKAETGNAWYIPGYGKNDTHSIGGTFVIIFDI